MVGSVNGPNSGGVLDYKIHLLGVISRPAAYTRCLSFFITSAAIHFLSTLTVRYNERMADEPMVTFTIKQIEEIMSIEDNVSLIFDDFR